MIHFSKKWSKRYFSNPQAVFLGLLLLVCLVLVVFMGHILAPVIASVIIAYLLQGVANYLIKWRIPRIWAVSIVYVGFVGIFLLAVLIAWPIIWQQLLKLYNEMPNMILSARQFINVLPEKLPQFITKETVDSWVESFNIQLQQTGKTLFTVTLTQIPTLIALVVYVVLVPMMTFFFLKDNRMIRYWFMRFLPSDRKILYQLWQEVNQQIGNYIRGKGLEVLIIGVCAYLIFHSFNLQYAFLLSFLVGLSVLIPYIGAVLVTFPVVAVAFIQWGLSSDFFYLVSLYFVLQVLDGMVLVPVLFSEVNNLHPVAIIVAVLIFGAWWGFWGVFFAIPLATFVKALLEIWPTVDEPACSS